MAGKKRIVFKDEGERIKKEGYELTAEVFAVGKWNGMEFERDDLESIVKAFNELGDRHRVPLKMGHNEQQPMTDGDMALGWVESLWLDGDKLMSKFVAMPEVVYNAIKQKRFRNVSIELDIDVQHKAREYPFVLSGVALLGADIPAVNTLADLQTYLHNRQHSGDYKRATFTALQTEDPTEQPNKDGATEMAMTAEEKQELENLRAQKAQAEADKAKFEREAQQRQDELERMKEESKKAEFASKRSDITKRLDDLVAHKRITPALRDRYTAEVKEDEPEAFSRVMFAVEALEEAGGQISMNEKGTGKVGDKESDTGMSPDEEVAYRAQKYMNESGMPMSQATFAVLREDAELAKRYRDMGTEHLK